MVIQIIPYHFFKKANCFNLLFFFFFSCQSTVKKNTDVILNSQEFKIIAQKFSEKISLFIQEKKELNPNQKYFLALLPTKNDTLNNLPIDILEFNLVNNLLQKKIFTVRREDRREALNEIELQLTGLSDNQIDIGTMKVPNYFIKIKIKENYFNKRNGKIVEQTILMEVRNVATQLVELSDYIEFIKEKKTSRSVVW